MRPMTVRQAFYQATVRGIVEKSEAGYNKVQTDLVQMRRSGMLPYGWLADNTRWQRKPRSFGGIEEALKNCAEFYRKDLWRQAESYVDAIDPERLRNLVETAIERHLRPEQFEVLKVAEESERQAIAAFVRGAAS
jgi:hypothetical protein